MPLGEDILAKRFQVALDLYQTGEKIMRQNLRRRHPEADEQEIENRLVQWLQTRPGAEQGDCLGPSYIFKTNK